jgi:branched-chain amino acid transport system permease protein
MQLIAVSTLNGVLYGMLLFMLASGLTVILSLMGTLNFAHASFYMLGAYFAFSISRVAGFWPALVLAPLLVGAVGAAVERWGLRAVRRYGHLSELLFTFGLAFVIEKLVMMIWGTTPVPYRIPPELEGTAFSLYGSDVSLYRVFMLAISVAIFAGLFWGLARTRVGLIVQAALTHPEMVGALGHNVPMIFTLVFGGGCALAALAGVIGGNYLVTNPGMALQLGPIVFVVVVLGGLGSLFGALLASLLIGLVQTFAVAADVSMADALRLVGVRSVGGWWFGEVLDLDLSRAAPMLPFLLLVLVLIVRPRGLLGTRGT